MNSKLIIGLAASLGLILIGCGGSPGENLAAVHTDTPTTAISVGNALAIAADVYQVAAVDAPFTASVAMDPNNVNAVNPTACTDAAALSAGNSNNMSGMGMGMGMGMDMIFNNCILRSSPSTHTLTVNGSCTNTDGSSVGIEVVTGKKISFTRQGSMQNKTLALHNFAITRNSDDMTNAAGSLHLADGGIVKFAATGFVGTAMLPTAGSLLITGASSSRLRLTIDSTGTPGTNFTLEVDADGDGNYETSTQYNWNNNFWMLIP